MEKLYTSSDIVRLMTVKSLLEEEIPYIVKNENLTYLAGVLPFSEVQPEIWVEDDDFEEAKKILVDNQQN